MDKRWRMPVIVSGLVNTGLVVALGLMGLIHVPSEKTTDPVEVSLIHDTPGSSGGSSGPQIQAPETAKVEIPPPITSIQDAQAILEQVKTEALQEQPKPISPSAIPSTSGTTESTGSGNGTGGDGGEGNGTGSDGGDGYGDGGGEGRIVDKGSLTLITDVQADYPPKLLRQGKTGSVTVQLIVERDGTVSDVEVLSSSGYHEFDRSVTNVAYQWRFVPATENGRPVRAYARRTYTFAL